MISKKSHSEFEKAVSLRRHHTLHPRPQDVQDPAFTSGNPFFDSRDLVQVKYEMLRRVRQEGQSVSQSAAAFGFSRPSFYQTQAQFDQDGLHGLVRQQPGPKRAHKLSEPVVDLLEATLAEDTTLNSRRLSQRLWEQLGLRVHPRSVERALARRRRKRGLK